ncbi:unnamed protein product [Penicillium discolor]
MAPRKTKSDENTKLILTAAMANPHPPYQIDPDGDIILFTPKASLIDITKGNVPGNYSRFQVSSKHLALASAYFKGMLKNGWAEGDALSTKGFAEIPVNDCKPDILLIILNLIHGRLRQIPLKLSLPQLSDIAVATDFFQCHEVVEVFAGIWIKALESLVPSSFSQDMKIWMMISFVFKSPGIFKRTTKIAMQQATGPFETSNLPIPKPVKDAIDKAREECLEKFELLIKEHILRLLSGPVRCSENCDAAHLGVSLGKMMTMKISSSLNTSRSSESGCAPSITVDLRGFSPDSICSMIKEWKTKLRCSGHNPCSNTRKPFGDDGKMRAERFFSSLNGLALDL